MSHPTSTSWKDRLIQHRAPILRWVQGLSFGLSLFSVGLILFFYGFPHDPEEQSLIVRAILSLFAFYALLFVTRALLARRFGAFLKENWKEFLLMLLLSVDSISVLVSNAPFFLGFLGRTLGFDLTRFYLLFIQGYLLLFVVLDLAQLSELVSKLNVRPATLLAGSFILLIFLGSMILMMPEMTVQAGSMDFLPALFTATSASCVTGLIVVDTATYFTFAGKLVIMLLFQLGGLGIITFTVFFSLFLRSGIGLKSQLAMKELLNSSNLVSTQGTLRKVISYTLIFELIGGMLIYLFWRDSYFADMQEKIFFVAFHAISAFCNAGFSLFSEGLMHRSTIHNYPLQLVIAGLIFFGGLGFPVLQDLFGIENLRRRMRYPWLRWEITTRIALFASLALLVFGAVMFFALERSRLAHQSATGQVVTALFQSITTRTAGFNTVAVEALQTPTLIIFLFLMFVGASSASTGGGIKTSTFVVLFKAVFSVIQGKQNMNIGKRTISPDTLNKAYAVFLFATSFIFTAVFLLTITDGHVPIMDLVFEEVSAFCTVGLSTGITADLSPAGQFIIIVSMFVGRVGILTLALALSTISNPDKFRYPRAQLIIG